MYLFESIGEAIKLSLHKMGVETYIDEENLGEIIENDMEMGIGIIK